MSKFTKNWNWMDQVQDVMERRRRENALATEIVTLTDKDHLRQQAYRALADEATTNGWSPKELRAGIAILREYFDSNRAIIGHVVAGAEKDHPGLPFAVNVVFDEVTGYDPELTDRLNLPGTQWRREADHAA